MHSGNLQVVRRAVCALAPGLDASLHPVLLRIYANRGIVSAAQLGQPLNALLPIGSLESVAAAAELLAVHQRQGASVLVIGDFDADGATSTVLIVRALRSWGFAAVDFLVPNRFEFGYGLTPEIVALAAQRNPTLIVTVDNGISSNAGVAAARAAGIDVLITDHHLPGAQLPQANVIVNPNCRAANSRAARWPASG
jgi:single-stranded-DNA-specific exonuclease